MRTAAVLIAGVATAVLACSSDVTPTQPDSGADALAGSSAASSQASDTWVPRAHLRFADQTGVTAGVVTTASGRSTVYAFGGIEPSEGGVDWPVQAYDVATDTWTVKAAVTHGFRLNGVAKIGGRLYYSGGYITHIQEYTNQLMAYDYRNDRLIPKHGIPYYTADGITGAVKGLLYVLPGTCSGDYWPYSGFCDTEPFRKLYRYDPVAGGWTKMAWCPNFHADGAGGVVNGKFYVVAGYGKDHLPTATLDQYDPASNTWVTRAPLPVASGYARGAVLNTRLYVVASTPAGPATYAYNPGTNSWARKAAPRFVHSALVPVVFDGKNYLFAVGQGSSGSPSELYAP